MTFLSRVLSDNNIATLPEKFLASNSRLTYLFAIVRARVRMRARARVRVRVELGLGLGFGLWLGSL